MLAPWKESYVQPGEHNKKQRYYFTKKGLSNQNYGSSSSLVMYGCDNWTIKKPEC